jgi:hypothetical protein
VVSCRGGGPTTIGVDFFGMLTALLQSKGKWKKEKIMRKMVKKIRKFALCLKKHKFRHEWPEEWMCLLQNARNLFCVFNYFFYITA